MKITVEMTAEEFQKFMEWQSDKTIYERELDKIWDTHEFMAKKVLWAVELDPKKPGKCKVIDHDHACELVELANEVFA